jgi:DNA invertase Pin-like site-specific DNA recombinase
LIKACGYFRLSREDGDRAESDSIKNQKIFVRDYANKNNLPIIEEYIDDGFTGTNFNRPSFTRLMDDIHQGKINCIIVKDLSRLGRNYIEMGRLISNILPSLGIRLIAINDNYDSIDEENTVSQIIVPFKNLINDAYCRDMSLKVRSQLDMKRRKGKFIGSFALYGYIKDPKDRNHLLIDETAAGVVELIFNLKMDGFSTGHIVSKLSEYEIPTPLEYKRICGMNYNSGFRSGSKGKWSPSTVDRILRNEMYTGTMI